jgi:hypothetical protein
MIEEALSDLIQKSEKANQAMRDYNRSGIEWKELEVARMLEPEIEAAYKRDPNFQEAMHVLKMLRKHGHVPE